EGDGAVALALLVAGGEAGVVDARPALAGGRVELGLALPAALGVLDAGPFAEDAGAGDAAARVVERAGPDPVGPLALGLDLELAEVRLVDLRPGDPDRADLLAALGVDAAHHVALAVAGGSPDGVPVLVARQLPVLGFLRLAGAQVRRRVARLRLLRAADLVRQVGVAAEDVARARAGRAQAARGLDVRPLGGRERHRALGVGEAHALAGGVALVLGQDRARPERRVDGLGLGLVRDAEHLEVGREAGRLAEVE